MWNAIEDERLAENVPIAVEHPLPQAVGEHDHRGRVVSVANVVGLDGSAEQRFDADKVEAGSRQEHAIEALCAVVAGHQHRLHIGGHDVGEGRQLLNLHKLAARVAMPIVQLIVGTQDEGRPNLIGLGIGIGRDKHPIHHAEQRNASADAEHEREQSDSGEAGIPPEAAQRVAHVLPEPFEPQPSPDLARFFADEENVAELCGRGATRFFGGHAGLDVLLGFVFDVRLNLALKPFAAFRPVHAGLLFCVAIELLAFFGEWSENVPDGFGEAMPARRLG